MWLHSWFAGAAMVTPENSSAIFFEQTAAPWTLTAHGRKAAEVFHFMQQHERGVLWTPVAIVLDHLAGYNGYMDKPWGILEPTAGDREVRDLFDHQLFPGSDHIHTKTDPANPEGSYLRATPYGEIFDVLLSTASPDLLTAYPIILLGGDLEFDDAFVDALATALRHGRQVLIAPRQREALDKKFERLKRQGNIQVLEPWTNPSTQRAAAISNDRLQVLTRNLPIEVTGDFIQYQINRTAVGGVIELVNNQGVHKKGDQPAVIDPKAKVRVGLKPRVKCSSAREWRSHRVHEKPGVVFIEVGPGETEFVEFVTERAR